MIRRRIQKGFSMIEYLVMLMILVSTLLVFKDYIIRGMTGRWKSVSDSMGHGRQYEPTDTVVCVFDQEFGQGWYDEICVENKNCAPSNKGCERLAIGLCNSSAFCQ